ncbi:MAG: anti-sigma F factor antagonist [Syntrophomonadaceae bacterium]|nr:anti-sigma F factor antagonist [Syntrophomonadaceae bacterium]
MDVDLRQVGNTLVVRMGGELDMLLSDYLREEIDTRLEQSGVRNLILNLEKVSFIDSSGLGLIIGRYKKLKALGGKIFIVGAHPPVDKILHFSGVNKLVPMYNSEQDIINI